MPWMTCVVPFPGLKEGIQDKFETVFMALGAPRDMALFSRTTPDFSQEVFLVSPAAAAHPLVRALADWLPEPDPFAHKWAGLVFEGDAPRRLGITLGH